MLFITSTVDSSQHGISRFEKSNLVIPEHEICDVKILNLFRTLCQNSELVPNTLPKFRTCSEHRNETASRTQQQPPPPPTSVSFAMEHPPQDFLAELQTALWSGRCLCTRPTEVPRPQGGQTSWWPLRLIPSSALSKSLFEHAFDLQERKI